MMTHNVVRYSIGCGATVLMLLLVSVGESYAQPAGYACWGVGPWMMGGAWGWPGGIMMLLFLGLVLIGMVFLIRWLAAAGGKGRQFPASATESPLDILKKRYARGEITKEQYESMRRDLE